MLHTSFEWHPVFVSFNGGRNDAKTLDEYQDIVELLDDDYLTDTELNILPKNKLRNSITTNVWHCLLVKRRMIFQEMYVYLVQLQESLRVV